MLKFVDRTAYIRDVLPALRLDPIIVDLADFLGITESEARERAAADQEHATLLDDWKRDKPALDEASIRRFYADARNGYLFTHAFGDRKDYSKYVEVRPFIKGPKLLDYGAGIGSIPLIVARLDERILQVDAADLESPHSRFARFRYRKYGCPIGTIGLGEEGFPEGRWSSILSLDVLEHMAAWREFVGWAAGALEPEGRLILRVGFDNFPEGALHVFDHTGLTPDALEEQAARVGMNVIHREDGELFVFENS